MLKLIYHRIYTTKCEVLDPIRNSSSWENYKQLHCTVKRKHGMKKSFILSNYRLG